MHFTFNVLKQSTRQWACPKACWELELTVPHLLFNLKHKGHARRTEGNLTKLTHLLTNLHAFNFKV